jgi:hypothetical protein
MIMLELISDDKEPETQAISIWPVVAYGEPPPSFYNDLKTLEDYQNIVSEIGYFYEIASPA